MKATTPAALLAAMLTLTACVSNEARKSEPAPQQEAAAAPAAAEPQAAPAPAPTAAKPVCKTETAKTATKKKTAKKTAKAAAPAEPDCVPAAAAATPAPAPVPAPAAAAAAAATAAGGAQGPYDLSKNKPVTDSTKVEGGQGTQVKGINDWQGEITGVPFPGAKFTKLKIGMSYAEAIDLVGHPTDEGAYVTGKAFIPFYFGSDRGRWEAAFKGQGRLIFSLQSGFGTGRYLTWIIYNPNERGYR